MRNEGPPRGVRGSMKTDGPRGIATAALLAVAGLALAVACVRAAVVKTLPPDAPILARLAPHDPDVVLDRATAALVLRHGMLDAATLDAVRRAAVAAPLDARPFLILGHQQLLDRQPARALATLEAGQRLDPRQRVIHLLLLDRYLRARRFADAATQFSISARLVEGAGGAVAAAMAQMSLSPATRDAVRRTLRADPVLERAVLVALAKADVAPSAVFALASPAALRDAGADASWGPALVARLVRRGRYADARLVWQRLYRLSAAQAAAPLFDAGLRALPGSPPFNWTLAASSLGAADLRGGQLAVDYYGRDSGELASQLLVLRAGGYRFDYTIEGSKTAAGPSVSWSLQCVGGVGGGVAGGVGGDGAVLMRAAVIGTGTPHRAGAGFTVPPGCPAQRLALTGEAGAFPAPMAVTLRDLDLHAIPAGGRR